MYCSLRWMLCSLRRFTAASVTTRPSCSRRLLLLLGLRLSEQVLLPRPPSRSIAFCLLSINPSYPRIGGVYQSNLKILEVLEDGDMGAEAIEALCQIFVSTLNGVDIA